MQRPEQIIDRVYQVGGDGLSHPADCSVYLVDLGDLVLIDAGTSPDPSMILENVVSLGFSERAISHVILTHCHIDHIGGASELRRRCGCALVSHDLDTMYIETGDGEHTAADMYGIQLEPTPVDRKISGQKETLSFPDGDLNFLHTPGHTPGSMSVLYSGGGVRVLFGQDVHGPLLPAFGSDRSVFLDSLRRLRDLNADILCEGHFGVFRPAEAVREYIEHYIAEYASVCP